MTLEKTKHLCAALTSIHDSIRREDPFPSRMWLVSLNEAVEYLAELDERLHEARQIILTEAKGRLEAESALADMTKLKNFHLHGSVLAKQDSDRDIALYHAEQTAHDKTCKKLADSIAAYNKLADTLKNK